MGIKLSEVSFAYYVPKKISNPILFNLKDINLKISSHDEFIAIVGHTGSGKSTLVQLFNALQFPSSGTVNINDEFIIEKKIDNTIDNKKYRKELVKKPNLKFKLRPLRKYTGLVFQFPEYQLFEETVLKDIMFAPKNFLKDEKEAEKRAREISGIIGIEDLLEKSPFSLSGGQMRKVAIAGILAADPDVLVLDEPTVGLDPIAKKELLELLKNINDKYHKTIIMITHDMDVVSEYVKRVVVLKQGKIMYDGSKEELFKNSDIVENCNLGYPSVVTLLKDLKKKLNLDIDEYQYNLNDAYKELTKKLGKNHE